jgi:hypothetical protein
VSDTVLNSITVNSAMANAAWRRAGLTA